MGSTLGQSWTQLKQLSTHARYDIKYTETMGFKGGSDNKESACNVGDPGSIPGLGRAPREVHGNPL